MSIIERRLIQWTSTDNPHHSPTHRRFAIDLRTGGTVPLEQLTRPRKSVFHKWWLKKAHYLLMRLINVRVGDPSQEWLDLVAFFRSAGYVPKGQSSWPDTRVERVAKVWREYRQFTRDLALARGPADWQRINERYPKDLVQRSSMMPLEKADHVEVYDPLDMMWIALTYSQVFEMEKGPRFAKCATRGCEQFVPAPWPPRGRPPHFCDPSCNVRARNLAGHNRRKKKYDDECRGFLIKALRSLPAKERTFSTHDQRMRLARKLYKMVRKQLEEVPGVRGERWIAKQLKNGVLDESKQRESRE